MNRNLRRLGVSLAASLLFAGLAGCELPGAAGNDPNKNQNEENQQNANAKTIHEGTISKNEVWKKADGPHLIRGDVYVESENGAVLTIEAGTVVQFEKGATLRVGYGSTSGVLKAEGTAESPITFTSALNNKAKGDWGFIWIGEGGTSTVMAHCKVMYGGGDTAAVIVDGVGNYPTIRNSVFENNAGYGIKVQGQAAFTAFENNRIASSEQNPIRLAASKVGTLGANNKFEANGEQAIYVEGDTISKSARWRNHGIPYRVAGDHVYVDHESLLPVLTIDSGTVVEFAANLALRIAYNGGQAALYAKGEAGNPIRFTGVRKDPGSWDGISMWDGTKAGKDGDKDTTVLEHVIIEYAGDSTSSDGALLYLNNANPFVRNVTFRYSETKKAVVVRGNRSKVPTFDSWGIYVNNGSGNVWGDDLMDPPVDDGATVE